MKIQLLDRYIFREIAQAWFASSLVLSLLLVGTIVTRYLSDAATGRITAEVLPQLAGLSAIQFSTVVLPFSLLIGIMLALGRLYRDNEMSAMHGAGMGAFRVARPVLFMALLVGGITAWVSVSIGPWAVRQHAVLGETAKNEATQMRFAEAGRFTPILGNAGVFYAARYDAANDTYFGVFIHVESANTRPTSIIAERASIQMEPNSRERVLVLLDGYRYEGVPGGVDYHITNFSEHGVRITPPTITIPDSKRGETMQELFDSPDRRQHIEFHWRLTLPLSVVFFALMTVPLAQARPREGRYGRLVAAMIVGVLYWNLLVGARYFSEKVLILPPAAGLWGLQLLCITGAFLVLARREGWGIRAKVITA